MSTRLRRVAARCAKRFLSILLMLAFLAGTAGIPVVMRAPKDHSQPFPCQDNPCGCSSAEECWHHCCCHTNREKVVWAREHGVTPPTYVVEAAKKESEPARTCCHRAGCGACAAKAQQAAVHDSRDADYHDAEHHNRKGKLRATLVLRDFARRCQGLSPLWMLMSDAIPASSVPVFAFDDRVVGSVIERPVLEIRVELSPPVPPPKLRALCG